MAEGPASGHPAGQPAGPLGDAGHRGGGPFPTPADLAARLALALRAAGVPVPPDAAARLVLSLALLAPLDRERLYWAARLTLVSDHGQLAAFDALFARLFGGRVPGRPGPPPPLPAPQWAPAPARGPLRPSRPPVATGVLAGFGRASTDGRNRAGGDPAAPEAKTPTVASREEALATKDFAAMDEAEAVGVARLLAALEVATPWRRMGRRTPAGPTHRRRVDLRRTLRTSHRSGGDPVALAYRRPSRRRRPLVLLGDISGSMEPYTRAYLHFFHRAAASGIRAEAFVFATRLTRLTQVLRAADVDGALAAAGVRAPDWSGGTRIGAAMAEFIDRFGRRGMARGAVVVIFSDGWERDDPAVLARQMSRLGRLAYRVVWVNPRKAAAGFSPLAKGMAAALPEVDYFVSGHTVAALAEVIEAIGGAADGVARRGGGQR